MNAQQLKNAILQDLFTTKDNWEEREFKFLKLFTQLSI